MSDAPAAELTGESAPEAATAAAKPPVPLSAWVLGVLGLVIGGGVSGAVVYSSLAQNIDQDVAQLKNSHQVQVKMLEQQAAEKQAELDRMGRQLKDAFSKREALLKERDTLAAKVKAFQGTLEAPGPVAGNLLPDTAALMTEPVEVRPVFQAGEPPAIRDGSRLLANRKDGLYVLTKAPESLASILRGGQIKVGPLHKQAAALPPAGAGLFELEGPSRVVLEANRPVFRWKPLAGGKARYQVTVTDDKGGEAAKSGWVEGGSWQPEQPLPRGKVYRWSMQVMQDEGQAAAPRTSAPATGFAIVGDKEMERLEAARKSSPDSPLVLGVAAAEAGLRDEAERQLLAFRRANPGNPIADALLAQVRLSR